MQDDTLQGVIDNLKKNSIFRMSLGSKELFHSNFLEYLWDLDEDHQTFITMINGLVDKPLSLPGSNYFFAREKKNFDICIFHLKEGKENKKGEKPIKEVFDLIIENKVKSIPYKEQLEEYKKVVTKNNKSAPCQYILLSLSEFFPDNDYINGVTRKDICGWHLINYKQLAVAIADNYKNHCYFKPYIEDYCSFVEQLVLLKNCILPQDINNQPLFDDCIIKRLKTIRVHDLYIKLRTSWFIMSLKRKLNDLVDFKDSVYVVHKYDDFNKDGVEQNKKKGIFLNADINQGNGQAAVWILNKNDSMKKGDTFEVVIQGKQYRHGIALCRKTKVDHDRRLRLNVLYDDIMKSERAKPFLDFSDDKGVFPPRENKLYFRDNNKRDNNKTEERIQKKGPFCCYDDSYIYRYKSIEDKDNVGKLLDNMIEDIKSIYPSIPKVPYGASSSD